MIWTAWVNSPNDRYPVEITNEKQKRPSVGSLREVANGTMEVMSRDLHVGHCFRVEIADPILNEGEAKRQFNGWRKDGLPANRYTSPDPPAPIGEKKMWRHRGAPHYLFAQARAMGLPDVMVKEAGGNEEIWKLDKEMAGVSIDYQTARQAQVGRFDDFPEPVKARAAGTLRAFERRCSRLHMLAAASMVAIDNAWEGFGMEPPERTYRVVVGPASVVEVRSTEDAQKIDAQNVEIAALKTNVDELEATIRNLRTVQTVVAEPVASQHLIVHSGPIIITQPLESAVEPTPTPEPIQTLAPPIPVKPHQNPKHPRNTGAR